MNHTEEIAEATDKVKLIKFKYYLLSKNLKWLEEPLEEYLDKLEDKGKLDILYANEGKDYTRLACDVYMREWNEYYDIYGFKFRDKFSNDYKFFSEDTYGREWVVLK